MKFVVRLKTTSRRILLLLGITLLITPTNLTTLCAQSHPEDVHPEGSAEHHATKKEEHGEESFDPSSFIIDHIKDSHEWHLWTNQEGHHVSVHLPVILFSKHSGFHVFMSKKLAHGHTYKGFRMGQGENEGKIVEVNDRGELVEAGLPLDFSLTKNAFMMLLAVVILIALFLSLARSYKRVGVSEPRGIQGFLEPLIVFVEEDIARPNIGEEKYRPFMPYLLTVFFFILTLNLMGLIPFFPFGANVTGNIAVTMVLALFTFFIVQFSGNRAYWQHIFNTPGVPWWLKYPVPMMPLVELVGMISKPFALMVRLFANITAGHIIVMSLVSLIFIFKTAALAPASALFVIFMDLLEMLVAFLQAYVFTLLSALFIGLAMPEHHHD